MQQLRHQQTRKQYFESLRGLPFWIWDSATNHRRQYELASGKCCYNHSIRLPRDKHGNPCPMFDYEELIYNVYETRPYVMVKKATGLGLSTFTLRYLAWKCLKDDSLKGTSICILTGPRLELSVSLIDRIKAQFLDMPFDGAKTEVTLNGVPIQAYPSHHLSSMRGIERPSYIFLDEADFWHRSEQDEARVISERYIGKSDVHIIMVSTPGEPSGLFQTIEQEPADSCIYHRIFLDWRYGYGKIFTLEDIERARKSPSWEREYCLKYTGGTGSAFSQLVIDKAVQYGKHRMEMDRRYYNVNIRTDIAYGKSLGVDVGFGSSKFAFCLTQLRADRRTGLDGKIDVLFCQEYERPDWNKMILVAADIIQRYGNVYCYVDGSSPEVITGIKQVVGEYTNYHEQLAKLKKNRSNPALYMKVLPVSFSKGGVSMLNRMKMLLDKGLISINPRFDKLILALRTCKEENGHVLKNEMWHDDIFDSFRLSLRNYQDYDPVTKRPITTGNDWNDVY